MGYNPMGRKESETRLEATEHASAACMQLGIIIEMIIGITIVIPVFDECYLLGIMFSLSHLLFHFFPYKNTVMLYYSILQIEKLSHREGKLKFIKDI